jgi:broad specificity phosphatase PhoE
MEIFSRKDHFQMTTLYFVRHGEVHNPDQIHYGRIPGYRLSERGEQEAERAAEFLAQFPLKAIMSSPQRRAQQTAQFIAGKHKLPVTTLDLLNEVYSAVDGQPIAELLAKNWDIYENLEPPYESFPTVAKRLLQAVEQLREGAQPVACVTHGDLIVSLHLWARGKPLTLESRAQVKPYPATASVTELRFTDKDLPEFIFHTLRPNQPD